MLRRGVEGYKDMGKGDRAPPCIALFLQRSSLQCPSLHRLSPQRSSAVKVPVNPAQLSPGNMMRSRLPSPPSAPFCCAIHIQYKMQRGQRLDVVPLPWAGLV
ncbi:hypothetical protein E2C01_059383 [Portunus trituberculatus]|uniref:Uncharacterized protein n=1 Tax=Portunus trituberculatus TaxID=210409 RepID=A0A5B7GYZ6_PORTR|nr:hypothetical protein [Portunus trituberculatus]